MNFWLPVIVIALATYLFRYSFIGGKIKFEMPELIKEALAFVPVAVMAALVALGFFVGEEKEFVLYPPSLAAAVAATGVALRFGRDLLTIFAGLIAYWLVDFSLM